MAIAILISRSSFDHDSKEWNYHVLRQKENALLQKIVNRLRGFWQHSENMFSN